MCVWSFYSMCDDNMDIITALRDMIDVRDGFKTCAYYTNNNVEDVINDIFLTWNVKLTGFFLLYHCFLLQCFFYCEWRYYNNNNLFILQVLHVTRILVPQSPVPYARHTQSQAMPEGLCVFSLSCTRSWPTITVSRLIIVSTGVLHQIIMILLAAGESVPVSF